MIFVSSVFFNAHMLRVLSLMKSTTQSKEAESLKMFNEHQRMIMIIIIMITIMMIIIYYYHYYYHHYHTLTFIEHFQIFNFLRLLN